MKIQGVSAMEILDSRGKPTVKATVWLDGGFRAQASVPSGASTGSSEAIEKRDGDPNRYNGQGCLAAVENVNGEIDHLLRGKQVIAQQELDQLLITLDGTPDKSRLGANAMLAVSIAFARAKAMARRQAFVDYLAEVAGRNADSLPRLTVNLFSGGKHAGGQVCVQDVLLVPVRAQTISQALEDLARVYASAEKLIAKKYGMRPLKADEGGLAPAFTHAQAMLEDAADAIQDAGLQLGTDMALAIDVASTQFYNNGKYELDQHKLDAPSMIQQISQWVEKYKLISVEDGLSEEDWKHWPSLKASLADKSLVMGDDFLCTNPARISRAIQQNCADALLLKVNQIGTLSEAAEALKLARSASWSVTVSARSGETEDDWLADLAVGWGADFIKVGSIRQSERLAKYNRLLEIEKECGWSFKN